MVKKINKQSTQTSKNSSTIKETQRSSILSNDPLIQKVSENALLKSKTIEKKVVQPTPLVKYNSLEDKKKKLNNYTKPTKFNQSLTPKIVNFDEIIKVSDDIPELQIQDKEFEQILTPTKRFNINQYQNYYNRQNKNFNRMHDFFSVAVNHEILNDKVNKIEDDVNYVKTLDAQIKEYENKILDILDDDLNLLIVKYAGKKSIPTNNEYFPILDTIYMNMEIGGRVHIKDKNINIKQNTNNHTIFPYTVNYDGSVAPTGSIYDSNSTIEFYSSVDSLFSKEITSKDFYGNVHYYYENNYEWKSYKAQENGKGRFLTFVKPPFAKFHGLYSEGINYKDDVYTIPEKYNSLYYGEDSQKLRNYNFEFVILKDKNNKALNKLSRSSNVELYFCTNIDKFIDFKASNKELQNYLSVGVSKGGKLFYLYDGINKWETTPFLLKLNNKLNSSVFNYSFNFNSGVFSLNYKSLDYNNDFTNTTGKPDKYGLTRNLLNFIHAFINDEKFIKSITNVSDELFVNDFVNTIFKNLIENQTTSNYHNMGFIVQFKHASNSLLEEDVFFKFKLTDMVKPAEVKINTIKQELKNDNENAYPLYFYEVKNDKDIKFLSVGSYNASEENRLVKYKLSDDRKTAYVLPYGLISDRSQSLLFSHCLNCYLGTNIANIELGHNEDKFINHIVEDDTVKEYVDVEVSFSENKYFKTNNTNIISKNHNITSSDIELNTQYLFLNYDPTYYLPNYIDVIYDPDYRTSKDALGADGFIETSEVNQVVETSEVEMSSEETSEVEMSTEETSDKVYENETEVELNEVKNKITSECIEKITFKPYNSFETFSFGSLEIILNKQQFLNVFDDLLNDNTINIGDVIFNIPLEITLYSGENSEKIKPIKYVLPVTNIYLSQEDILNDIFVTEMNSNTLPISLKFENYEDKTKNIAIYSNRYANENDEVKFKTQKLLALDFSESSNGKLKFKNDIDDQTYTLIFEKQSSSSVVMLTEANDEDNTENKTFDTKSVVDKLSNACYKTTNTDLKPLCLPSFDIKLYKFGRQISIEQEPDIHQNNSTNHGWILNKKDDNDIEKRFFAKGKQIKEKKLKFKNVSLIRNEKVENFNKNNLELFISNLAGYDLNLVFDIEQIKVINRDNFEINENFNQFVLRNLTGSNRSSAIMYSVNDDEISISNLYSDFAIKLIFKSESTDVIDENYLVYGNSISLDQTINDEDNIETATFFTQSESAKQDKDDTTKYEGNDVFYSNISIGYDQDYLFAYFNLPFMNLFKNNTVSSMYCIINNENIKQTINNPEHPVEFYNLISKYHLSNISKITFFVKRTKEGKTGFVTKYIININKNSRGLKISTINFLKNLTIGSLNDFGALKLNQKSDYFNMEIVKMFNSIFSNKIFYNRPNNILNNINNVSLETGINIYNKNYVGVNKTEEHDSYIKSFSYFTNYNNANLWGDKQPQTFNTSCEILMPGSLKYLGTIIEPIFFNKLQETVYPIKSFIDEIKLPDVLTKYLEFGIDSEKNENDFINDIFESDFSTSDLLKSKIFDFIRTNDPNNYALDLDKIKLNGTEIVTESFDLLQYWKENKDALLSIYDFNLNEYDFYKNDVLQFYDYDETLLKEDLILYSEYMFKKFEPNYPNNELHIDILNSFLKTINPDNNVICRQDVFNRLATEFFKDSKESNFQEMNAYIYNICYSYGMFNIPPVIDTSVIYDIVNTNKVNVTDTAIDGLTTFKYIYDDNGHQCGIRKQFARNNNFENEKNELTNTYKYYIGDFNSTTSKNSYICETGKLPRFVKNEIEPEKSYYSALKITQTGNVIPFKYVVEDINNGKYNNIYNIEYAYKSVHYIKDEITNYSINNANKRFDISHFSFIEPNNDDITYTASYIFYTGAEPKQLFDKDTNICIGYNAFSINKFGNVISSQFLFDNLLEEKNNITYKGFSDEVYGKYRYKDEEIKNPVQYLQYPCGTNVYTYNFDKEKYFINSYEFINKNNVTSYASYLYKIIEPINLYDTIDIHTSFINLHKLNLEKNANLIDILNNVKDVLSIKNNTNSISYELVNCYTDSNVLRTKDETVNVILEYTYTDIINEVTSDLLTEIIEIDIPKNTYIYEDYNVFNAYNSNGKIWEDVTVSSDETLFTGKMSYTYEVSNAGVKNEIYTKSHFMNYIWKDRELIFECKLPIVSYSTYNTEISIGTVGASTDDITNHPLTYKEHSYIWIGAYYANDNNQAYYFGIASENAPCGMVPWSYAGNDDLVNIKNLPAFSTLSKYIHTDFDGIKNTRELLSKIKSGELGDAPAAREAKNFIYNKRSNLKKQHLDFYLGSVSEWQIIEDNIDEINEKLSDFAIKGVQLYDGKLVNDKPENKYFWTSTECDEQSAWTTSLTNYSGEFENKNMSRFVRPLFKMNTKYNSKSFYGLTGKLPEYTYEGVAYVNYPKITKGKALLLKKFAQNNNISYTNPFFDDDKKYVFSAYTLTTDESKLITELNNESNMYVFTKLYVKKNNFKINTESGTDFDSVIDQFDACSYIILNNVSSLNDYVAKSSSYTDRLYLEIETNKYESINKVNASQTTDDRYKYSTYLMQFFVFNPKTVVSIDTTYQIALLNEVKIPVLNNNTYSYVTTKQISSQKIKQHLFDNHIALTGDEKIFCYFSNVSDLTKSSLTNIYSCGEKIYDAYVYLTPFTLSISNVKTKYSDYLKQNIFDYIKTSDRNVKTAVFYTYGVGDTQDGGFTHEYPVLLSAYNVFNKEYYKLDDNKTPYTFAKLELNPTKAETPAHTYTFENWNPNPNNLTGDAESFRFHPIFGETLKVYNVKFYLDEAKTRLVEDNIPAGSIPTYQNENEDPTKAETIYHTYTFSGWNPTPVPIFKDTKFEPVFSEEPRKYTLIITYLDNYGESVTKEDKYNYNFDPTNNLNMLVYDYINGEQQIKNIQDNYTTYEFIGWDKEITNVTENKEYIAQYNEITRQYTYTFYYEGAIMCTGTTNAGSTPEYTGETPSKPQTEYHTYTFVNWDPEVKEINKDMNYNAIFSQDDRYYTYIFNVMDENNNKTEYSTGKCKYGEEAQCTNNPVKTSYYPHTYTFDKWYKEGTMAGEDGYNLTIYKDDVNFIAQFTENWEIENTINIDLTTGNFEYQTVLDKKIHSNYNVKTVNTIENVIDITASDPDENNLKEYTLKLNLPQDFNFETTNNTIGRVELQLQNAENIYETVYTINVILNKQD